MGAEDKEGRKTASATKLLRGDVLSDTQGTVSDLVR